MSAQVQGRGKVWASLGAAVLTIVAGVFSVEGGYSTNPADPGGETNHGVNVQVARDAGYTGPMHELSKEFVEQLYGREYIERPNFHRVIPMLPAVGAKLVDAGVNAGPGALRARVSAESEPNLSRGSANLPLVSVDGQVGAQSLAASQAMERKRGRLKACELTLKLVDAQQGAHYMGLNKPMFIVGWADNRLGNVPLARRADSVAGGAQ